MGTASGVNTRRYHGLLVAATDPPVTRVRLLAGIEGFAEAGGERIALSSNRYPDDVYPEGYKSLNGFTVGDAAEWVYAGIHLKVNKALRLTSGENTVVVVYRNDGNTNLALTLRPLVCHQFYHGDFYCSQAYPASLGAGSGETTITHDGIALRLIHSGCDVREVREWYYQFQYPVEASRGLNSSGDLYCPCELHYSLAPGEEAVLVATTERNPTTHHQVNVTEGNALVQKLTHAAEKFLVHGHGRSTVIAGYPWFTDWGRDTMIALPGLCLCTGRIDMARAILSDFASQMHQGLIPNRFVEAGEQPAYNTVDATLWFVNAVYQTLESDWNQGFADRMVKVLREVYEWHMRGTLFGIKVDPHDGLLEQTELGIQCTWMDAKIGDWVVTPRNGKAVEICALWLNALRVMEWLFTKLGLPCKDYREQAEKGEESFRDKFWGGNYYSDTLGAEGRSLRPNQVIAMSLPFSPVDPSQALLALSEVRENLLTTVGLRTLASCEPAYKGRFRGGLAELDAAYHQGTVWPWLMGPYCFASMKLTGSCEEAQSLFVNAEAMLEERGLGGIAEVYDGDEPRQAAGCPWQAWSVAEYLRVACEIEKRECL